VLEPVTTDDPQLSPTAPPLLGRSAAMSLGAALLVGLAITAVLARHDRLHRTELERAEEVTAVGDVSFFKPPTEAMKPPPVAAKLDGQLLYPVSYKPFELQDSRMIRVATDSEAGLNIYETALNVAPQEGEREKVGEKFYFLKIAPKQYIRVRVGTPGM
jgi:hypothetical protein